MVAIRSMEIYVDDKLKFEGPNMKEEIPEYDLRAFAQGKLEEITHSEWKYESECAQSMMGRAIDYEFRNSQGQIARCVVVCSPDL